MNWWFVIALMAWTGWAILKWTERRDRKRAAAAWRAEYESHTEQYFDHDRGVWMTRWKP